MPRLRLRGAQHHWAKPTSFAKGNIIFIVGVDVLGDPSRFFICRGMKHLKGAPHGRTPATRVRGRNMVKALSVACGATSPGVGGSNAPPSFARSATSFARKGNIIGQSPHHLPKATSFSS